MELYLSILKLAPLMLLKLFATGAFGPSEQDDGRHGPMALTGDVILVISVIVGGLVAVLVVGDVMPPTTTTRWTVVIAGCLSLLLLAVSMLREIASLHKARPDAGGAATSSGEAAASPGQAG